MVTVAPKRRWYQFSLKTLLVVMVVSCFVFAWIGSRMRQAKENRDRVAAVEKSVADAEKNHATVVYEYAKRRSATWLEELFDDPGGPADPVVVLEVRSVMFSLGSDTDLQHLKGMKNLKKLELGITGATDANLENLSELLPNLHVLGLSNCQINDAGLEHLKGLTNLRVLNLSHSFTDAGLEHITDAGLEHLKGLTHLEHLKLNSTNVSDAGLEHLRGLTNLRILNLKYTYVTDEGVKKLQQALPNCTIYHYPP